MVSMAVTVGTHGAYGGIMHSDVTLQTYTDFGQNMGRYAVGGKVNALLEEIRNREGGITVSYTDGQGDRVAISNTQGMINFSGRMTKAIPRPLAPIFLPRCAITARWMLRLVSVRWAVSMLSTMMALIFDIRWMPMAMIVSD